MAYFEALGKCAMVFREVSMASAKSLTLTESYRNAAHVPRLAMVMRQAGRSSPHSFRCLPAWLHCSICMISGYKTLGFRDRILHFLLWILQTLILCQETCSRWWEAPGNQLRAGLEAFKGTSYRANPRGRQPAFPKTVAIIFAEEWLASVSLDGLAALLHW